MVKGLSIHSQNNRLRTNRSRHELELAIVIQLLVIEYPSSTTRSTRLKSRMVYEPFGTLLKVQ